MQMNDSQRIPASREQVWAALNDPAVLKQCIPGCQSLDVTGPNEMTATVIFKVGPVKATFGGKVTLSDLDPPNGWNGTAQASRCCITTSTLRSAASLPSSVRG